MAKVPRRPKGQKQKIANLRRGEIYLCSFDPTVGHEIKKTRPALIIQNDVGNRYSPLTIVAAITSSVPHVSYPVEVVINPTASTGLDVESLIRLDQIRTVDRERLIRRLGVADTVTMAKVDGAIKISLGLVRL
jgi:mRNA interferase MazF